MLLALTQARTCSAASIRSAPQEGVGPLGSVLGLRLQESERLCSLCLHLTPCCVILSNFITSLSLHFISTSGKSDTSLSPDGFPFSVPPAYAPSAKGPDGSVAVLPSSSGSAELSLPLLPNETTVLPSRCCAQDWRHGGSSSHESLPKASLPPALKGHFQPSSWRSSRSVRRHHSCSSKHPLAPTSLQVGSPGLLAVSYLLHLLTHPPPLDSALGQEGGSPARLPGDSPASYSITALPASTHLPISRPGPPLRGAALTLTTLRERAQQSQAPYRPDPAPIMLAHGTQRLTTGCLAYICVEFTVDVSGLPEL